MSWAVDGTAQAHQRCRRRLTMAERIPHIVAAIKDCAPDLVALQDSTTELAQALTKESSSNSCNNTTQEEQGPQLNTEDAQDAHETSKVQAERGYVMQNATTLQHLMARRNTSQASPADNRTDDDATADATHEAALTSSSPASPSSPTNMGTPNTLAVSYRLVGSAVNGKCGAVQLFARTSSRWHARLDLAGPGVTAEISYGNDDDATPASSSPSPSSAEGTHEEKRTRGARALRFVLTVVDLAYRGKSVALHGRLLSSPEVSLEGNPHTLTAIPSEAQDTKGSNNNNSKPTTNIKASYISNERAQGQLDPHRALVLDHIARSTRADVVVGNTFLSQKESMPGYVDAWAVAGAPRAQERTTDTRAPRAEQEVNNGNNSGNVSSNYYYFVPSVLTRGRKREARSTAGNDGTGKKKAENEGSAEKKEEGGKEEQEEQSVRVGEDVALTAVYTGVPGHFRTTPHHTSTPASLSDTTQGEGGRDAGEELSVPEVVGRFQRCFLRHGNTASRTHKASYPFVKRYTRVRVVVPRPFVQVTLSEAEAAWHREHRVVSRRAQRRLQQQAKKKKSEDEKVGEEEEKNSSKEEEEKRAASRTVMCSLSDQYPLLTLFT